MTSESQLDDLSALREAARAAQFDLTVAFERIAQKVAAGDSFTTAQQNAAAQLLEIAGPVRELAAETDAAEDPHGVWGTQVTRAQQLVTRTAELCAAFGQQAVSQADLTDRPGRPPGA